MKRIVTSARSAKAGCNLLLRGRVYAVCLRQTLPIRQDEQDGSEGRAVELERLIVAGRALIARRDVLEAMRDQAADLYQSYMRSPWRARSGSQVNHRARTSSADMER